jgi:hypothetical protein
MTCRGIRLRLFVDATKNTNGRKNIRNRQTAITSQDVTMLR